MYTRSQAWRQGLFHVDRPRFLSLPPGGTSSRRRRFRFLDLCDRTGPIAIVVPRAVRGSPRPNYGAGKRNSADRCESRLSSCWAGTSSFPNTAAGIDVRFLALLAKWVDRIVALCSADARAAADIGAAPFAVDIPCRSNLLAWSLPKSPCNTSLRAGLPARSDPAVPQAVFFPLCSVHGGFL